MTLYQTRISRLREFLKKEKLDYFLFADADGHFSEYVGDYFKMRTAFSGFTGSNGTLLVGRDKAYLWTDGRYFIQAEKELDGSGIVLMKMGMSGVPGVSDFISQLPEEHIVLGVDEGFVSYQSFLLFRDKFGKKADIKIYKDVLRGLLEYSDATCCYREKKISLIRVLPSKYLDFSVSDRIKLIRENMLTEGANVFFSGKLDANMWLMGIRGNDIEYNPYAFSYILITGPDAFLMVYKDAVTEELKKHCAANGVVIRPYDDVLELLREYCANSKVASSFDSLKAYLVEKTKDCGISWADSDCGLALKQAVKSEAEIIALKEIYQKDSAAVCKFLYWLSRQEAGTVTEYQAAEKMNELRGEISSFKELSFSTIAAYGSNAAMMHYEPDEDHPVYLEKGNVFLLDSGGQYDGGTTDVTRTVAVGKVSEEIRSDYTAVIKGMLALQNAYFMYGCTGMNLDILARAPIWEKNMNYNCGTGHGIGFMLGVHEGPQAIRTKGTKPASETPFMAGMLVSDEPGIYKEGKYGIRVENVLLCREASRSEEGIFMKFEPLTFVPLDSNLICRNELSEKELKQIQDYQELVCEKMKNELSQEEFDWLVTYAKII